MIAIIKAALIYIWQLPQHLAALALYVFLTVARMRRKPYNSLFRPAELIVLSIPRFGLCLGEYIFVGYMDLDGHIIRHEKGHRVQSRCLGPLYLIVVGLPSITRNIWQRIFKKSAAWYYSGWPEADANRRAGLA